LLSSCLEKEKETAGRRGQTAAFLGLERGTIRFIGG
jgi:hypothetical protein